MKRRLIISLICIGAFLSCGPHLHANYAFVQASTTTQTGTGASANTYVITMGAQVTAANMLVGFVTWDSGCAATVTSISDDGTGATWTVKTTTTDSTNTQASADFYGYGWSVGPTNITAHFSVACDTRGGSLEEFSGQPAGDPLDGTNLQAQVQQTPGTGTDGAKSGSGTLTPSTANGLIWGGGVNTGALGTGTAQYTAGTNFTKPTGGEHNVNGDLDIAAEYWIQTTATAANSSWTLSVNTAHITMMMIFKGAGGGSVVSGSGKKKKLRALN